MRLDSVRGLKAELASSQSPTAALAEELSIAPAEARRVSRRLEVAGVRFVAPDLTRVALGVARRRDGEHLLGVRVVGAGVEATRLARAITERTRGECDVRVLPRLRPRIRPAWVTTRRRPLEAGASIGHVRSGTGSIGAFVEDARGVYALSNNHVLGMLNDADPGDPAVQPGTLDAAASDDNLVAVFDRAVKISFKRANQADAALARLLPDESYFAGWNAAARDVVTRTRAPGPKDLGRKVVKIGRSTGITHGTIAQVEIDNLAVDYGDEGLPRPAEFDDQIEIVGTRGPFSGEGDSGSLVVLIDGDSPPVGLGLLFCGGLDGEGVDRTYANPLSIVLARLNVKLAR